MAQALNKNQKRLIELGFSALEQIVDGGNVATGDGDPVPLFREMRMALFEVKKSNPAAGRPKKKAGSEQQLEKEIDSIMELCE